MRKGWSCDKSSHQGDQWHKELLEQMMLDVPGLRDTSMSLKKDLDNFIYQMRIIYKVNK